MRINAVHSFADIMGNTPRALMRIHAVGRLAADVSCFKMDRLNFYAFLYGEVDNKKTIGTILTLDIKKLISQ